jgi:hypothetical protein
MVKVLIQPRWFKLGQYYALRAAYRDLHIFINRVNNERWASGNGSISWSNPLDHKEVCDWISDRYIELRGAYRIRMSFQEFQDAVFKGHIWIKYQAAPSKGFRSSKAYVRNTEHKPKAELDNSWYIEKHHKRDKGRHGSWSRSAPRFWVRQAARDHRAWIKQKISKGDWDAFSRGADDSEYIIDRWKWD